MAKEGLTSLFPLEDIAVMGFSAVIARLPTILRRIRFTADAVGGGEARHAHHHRQSGLHPPGRQGGPAARAADPDRRLCQPLRLGLAAGPRAEDARLCRSPPGPAALRAGGAPAPRWSADDLCRPPADRAPRRDPAGARRARGARTTGRSSFSSCPAAAAPRSSRLMEPFGAALALLQERSPRPFEVTIPAVAASRATRSGHAPRPGA